MNYNSATNNGAIPLSTRPLLFGTKDGSFVAYMATPASKYLPVIGYWVNVCVNKEFVLFVLSTVLQQGTNSSHKYIDFRH